MGTEAYKSKQAVIKQYVKEADGEVYTRDYIPLRDGRLAKEEWIYERENSNRKQNMHNFTR